MAERRDPKAPMNCLLPGVASSWSFLTSWTLNALALYRSTLYTLRIEYSLRTQRYSISYGARATSGLFLGLWMGLALGFLSATTIFLLCSVFLEKYFCRRIFFINLRYLEAFSSGSLLSLSNSPPSSNSVTLLSLTYSESI